MKRFVITETRVVEYRVEVIANTKAAAKEAFLDGIAELIDERNEVTDSYGLTVSDA